MENNPNKSDLLFAKPLIPDIHVERSRTFRSQVCESEYISNFGKCNDNNREKYFLNSKISNGDVKPYSDYMKMAQGTNKYSSNPQGYTGI